MFKKLKIQKAPFVIRLRQMLFNKSLFNKSRIQSLTVFFLVAMALITFNTWILSANIERLKDQEKWVEHTDSVLLNLEKVFSAVKDEESGERGFLLSGDETSVDRIRSFTDEAWRQAAQTSRLTADNPIQIANVKIMNDLLKRRFELTEFLFSGKFNKKNKAEVALYLEKSRDFTAELRRHVDLMREHEQELLQKRRQAAAKNETVVTTTLSVATFINFLLAISFFILARRQILRQLATQQKAQHENWIKAGQVEANRIFVNQKPIAEIAQELQQLMRFFLEVPATNLYVLNEGRIQLVEGSGRESSVQLGLVQSVIQKREILTVTNIPPNYFKISSSFGEALPNELIFLPIEFQNSLIGVLELASFKSIDERFKEWLQAVAGTIGAGLSATMNRTRQQLLLEETQRQSEELQMQQEELRTNNEELEEQAKVLEAQQSALNQRNQELLTAKVEVERKANDLERTNQYKSEFLAKMSHELRTPLNSLMILATLLQENKTGNLSEQQIDFARTIHESGADLLTLINDILDLSKLEARKLTARIETFSVRSFFDQLVINFRPQIEAKGLALRLHIDSSLPENLTTDRQRLQQILRNFISNAIKFTEQGEIQILADVAENKANSIRLTVADSGIGISPEKKHLIFEAFEQADGSISRKYGGTGLGLTISRELAYLLGGQISVESESGKGSRFALEIPVNLTTPRTDEPLLYTPLPPPVPAPVQVLGSEIAKSKLEQIDKDAKTILVVEDELTFRRSVSEAARTQGFVPLEAEDAETALAILKIHTPKAIMLDIKLPGMSGLTLLEQIKEIPHLRHIPIHMISAMEYQQSALRMGAVGYLGKPVTIEGVRSALNRIESILSQSLKRLLVIEDDEAQRKAIAELVGGQDVEITSVATGAEALEQMQKANIDCMILDLSLPDMTGFELLERLNEKENLSLPPVIIYTGKELSPQENQNLRRYSDSIIIKGAKSPERLLDEVTLFLHRIETSLPADKRAMLADLRLRDRHFDGRTILIVDDDLRNVFALTSALESKGFSVRVARNGLEAIEALGKFTNIDAVLMDIMMPKMDGFEAMKQIRQNAKFQKLPIIALTAKTMKGEHERCVQAGANDYLPKPVNLMNLISVLKVWLPPPEMLL